jgi:hypothetical protein
MAERRNCAAGSSASRIEIILLPVLGLHRPIVRLGMEEIALAGLLPCQFVKLVRHGIAFLVGGGSERLRCPVNAHSCAPAPLHERPWQWLLMLLSDRHEVCEFGLQCHFCEEPVIGPVASGRYRGLKRGGDP